MKITKIPKGNGKFRTIYCPSPTEKLLFRGNVPHLNSQAIALDIHKVAHGFLPGRSIVTNALAHVGDWQITLHFDFENFFDSVTSEMLPEPSGLTSHTCGFHYAAWIRQNCFPDGAARQGLPTSPAIANIAAAPFDAAVIALRGSLTPKRRILGSRGPAFVYTRYADDLTFSCNSEAVAARILKEIPALAAAHGFKINTAKTTRQHARAGHRIVTGIAATPTGILPTRQARRKLRAASHQIKSGLRRRNLRRILTKQAESYHRDDPFTMHRIGDILRAQWRGLASFIRLIPPHHRTDHPVKTSTTTNPNKIHKPSAAIPMPFGAFNRKITA
jgi:RNA-directed DNA polymerase